ncbi:MAG: thermonuclease family protein [Elusimicrobia bacterium]|nr:thermonuclease family protein [Elusimicrobiota bacterium]
MTNDNVLTTTGFTKLVTDIRQLITQGRDRARTAANNELIQTYWAIGGRIEVEGLTENAGYGDAIMEHLAEALDIDRSTLVRCVQLYRAYPKSAPQGTLTWSHIRLLLTVNNPEERKRLKEEAEKNDWTRQELAKAINVEAHPAPKDGKQSKQLKRPAGGPFVYRAEVIKVVDGDTLVVRLDLGFQVWKEQRIRLSGIDTPPIKEDGGPEAYEYTQTQLAKAKVVVVRTGKIDIYGRYVGDVFYSTDEDDTWEKVFLKGAWLNNELLEKGLARKD